jgi:ATP-dependent Clp protease ATP-binding subunit ClpA
VTVVFERCDADVRAIVDSALGESRQRSHSWLGTEHVLLAMALRRDLLPSAVAAVMPEAGAIAAALDAELTGPPRLDADLLAAVGVDLEAVRASVRRTFGQSSLEDLGRRRVHQPWQPWRRPARRCMSVLAGSLSIAPRLKRAFENARQEADRRKQALIDPAALLVGMLQVEDAMANRILRAVGVDPERLEQSLRSLDGG